MISRTSERTRQSDGGRRLIVIGNNPKGSWERTLIASGYPDFPTPLCNLQLKGKEKEISSNYTHMQTTVLTADRESVQTEAWWECGGTVHRSWLRGGKKYGGGDFESLRYLADEGRVLVCKSIFHPRKKKKLRAEVIWRFIKEKAP